MIVRTSNDRPNIHLVVERMQYGLNSMRDLQHILQLDGKTRPPKFMAFINRRGLSEEAVNVLWEDFPLEARDRVVWFHSGMSTEFREDHIRRLRSGDTWGLVCTDAAGMVSSQNISRNNTERVFQGLDILDIELVVQVGYVPSLCTLMQ